MEISTNFSIAQKSTETVPENFLTGKFGEISVFYALYTHIWEKLYE